MYPLRKTHMSKSRSKPGPKIQSKTQKEQVFAIVAKYDRRGYTQLQIVEKLKEEAQLEVTQPTVSDYLKQLRTQYASSKLANREELINEKIEQLKEVRREAWEAYERSKADYRKKVREKAPKLEEDEGKKPKLKLHVGKGTNRNPDKGEVEESMRLLRVIVTREGRLPSDAFLKVVIQTIEAEAKLQGLLIPIAAEDADKGKPKVEFDWETFVSKLTNPNPDRRVTVEATPPTSLAGG